MTSTQQETAAYTSYLIALANTNPKCECHQCGSVRTLKTFARHGKDDLELCDSCLRGAEEVSFLPLLMWPTPRMMEIG